jgi:hypothetical protein
MLIDYLGMKYGEMQMLEDYDYDILHLKITLEMRRKMYYRNKSTYIEAFF